MDELKLQHFSNAFESLDERKGVIGYHAAMYLVILAHKHGSDHLNVTLSDVELSGQGIGSWRVTFERVESPGKGEIGE